MYQDENGMLLIIMLIWTSFVSQFVHSVGGEGIVILASYKFHFIRVHYNPEDPENNKFIY